MLTQLFLNYVYTRWPSISAKCTYSSECQTDPYIQQCPTCGLPLSCLRCQSTLIGQPAVGLPHKGMSPRLDQRAERGKMANMSTIKASPSVSLHNAYLNAAREVGHENISVINWMVSNHCTKPENIFCIWEYKLQRQIKKSHIKQLLVHTRM